MGSEAWPYESSGITTACRLGGKNPADDKDTRINNGILSTIESPELLERKILRCWYNNSVRPLVFKNRRKFGSWMITGFWVTFDTWQECIDFLIAKDFL